MDGNKRKRKTKKALAVKGDKSTVSTEKMKLTSDRETQTSPQPDSSEDRSDYLSCLPDVPLFVIASYLNLSDLHNFAHTCNNLYEVCTNSKKVWAKSFQNEDLRKKKHSLSDQQVLFIVKTWQSKKLLQLERYLLHIACKHGDLKIIKFIMNTFEVDVNESDGFLNPILIAAKFGHLEVVRFLVKECGAEIDCVEHVFEHDHEYINDCWQTPLLVAIHFRHFKVAECLVNECGADAEDLSERHLRPIHLAIYNKDLQAVKCLVEKCGVDVNLAEYEEICIPLHFAIMFGNLEIVKFLVESGADPNQEDGANMKPWECADDDRMRSFLKSVTTQTSESEADSS